MSEQVRLTEKQIEIIWTVLGQKATDYRNLIVTADSAAVRREYRDRLIEVVQCMEQIDPNCPAVGGLPDVDYGDGTGPMGYEVIDEDKPCDLAAGSDADAAEFRAERAELRRTCGDPMWRHAPWRRDR